VLDASAFVAAFSPSEVHHAGARALYLALPGDVRVHVPCLFRLEVLSAFARRGSSAEILDALDLIVSGPRFQPAALDAALLDCAAEVARRARLRA